MEVAKFQACNECGGTGRIGGQICNTCFGHDHFYFSDNNLVFWQKDISYAHIFIRETKKTIDIVINALLIVAAITTIILLYTILNQIKFDPRALLDFINTPSENNFMLWSFITLDMYLYYRLTKVNYGRKQRIKLLKNKEVYLHHNIADNLSQESAKILDKTWLYANYKKVFPVTVWHLLYILLDDREIRLVLARLGIGSENIKKKIDNELPTLIIDPDKRPVFTETLKNVLLNAYLHMHDRQSQQIAEVDLLYGLVVSSQAIKNFFYDFDIDEEKIDNVIAWVRINNELMGRYRRFRSKSFFKPKSGINRSYTAVATPILNSFSQDLTLMAKYGGLPLTVAREREVLNLINTMESDMSSVVLVGPSGVGKDRIVEGIANQMMAEEVPEMFQDKRLVSISVPLLISGATGTGILEERFLAMLQEVMISGNIILHIENIHQLIGVSSEGNEGVDLSQVLASEIRKRSVIIIGTTDNKSYVDYLEGSELGNILKKINIEEPDKNQTIQIMEAHVGTVEAKHNIYFTYSALERIYDLSDRYIPDQYLPKKAIDLMDEAGIFVAKSGRQDRLVREEDIEALISHKTNIPLTNVTAKESTKLMNLEEEIHQRVIGQEEAVKIVSSALRRARAELRDTNRPIVNLLFLGPTGVGKTELAKTVAEVYFGKEDDMIRLDMSEYQNQDSIARLIGSPQNRNAGLLTEAVRHKPFALLLLDEMEKAHPDILNVFLQVMEDGRLTDAMGRTVDFTNLIIVATSNAGTSYIQDQISQGKKVEDFRDDLIKEELRSLFRPEFLNRFDGVVVFRPLEREEIYQIAGLMLKKVQKRLDEKGIFFEVTEAAKRELAEAGFDPVFGARPLRRVIQERVDNALSEFLLRGGIGRRDVIVYDVGGKISVRKPTGYN
ncbi:ATP-dependent Clp protease ATP-binding subunit [Candidatus Parcubacteria bacterium]|nr:MAG: ATP-dependent Clp protease ATP-binding subunit [Candidatus Parcubacteria bacterium]